MNNFIHEDYISDLTICDKLVTWFHSNKKLHTPGRLNIGGKWIIEPKEKQSTDFSFEMDEKILIPYLTELQVILNRFLKMYAFAAWAGSFGIKEQINIQYYKPNEGYRTFHFERGGAETGLRHLAFQTYLNTVEDGGETEFFYQQYKCKAVKGKTLIWPVDWTHTHRGIVSPTEEKYIITGWFSFE